MAVVLQNYEVELTRAPDILGTGVGIPGIEPKSTLPGPATSRGPATFPSTPWAQPGTITPLWLTQPDGAGGDVPVGSPAKVFWPQTFGTASLWGLDAAASSATSAGLGGSGNGEGVKPAPPPNDAEGAKRDGAKPVPIYTSIFFDTSLLPANEAIQATSPSSSAMDRAGVNPSQRPAPSYSPFLADFTFEKHLDDEEERNRGWFYGAGSSGYSTVPTSACDLNQFADLSALSGSSKQDIGPPESPTQRWSASANASPNSQQLYASWLKMLDLQNSWEDEPIGDWASVRRRGLFGSSSSSNGNTEDDEKQSQKQVRTEIVDVAEYTRMGGALAANGRR